jgi:uncharacterized membrane protein (GlpM family)
LLFSGIEVIRLLASFAAGAVIVGLVTTLADMFGEGPAGFLGGLPTSGGVSLLFIGLTQSTAAAVQATTLFPLGFASTFSFLLFFAVPKKLGLGSRMVVSLGLWLPISAAIALLAPIDFAISVGASIIIAVGVILVRRRIVTPRVQVAPSKPGLELTILRAILGGSVVASVVILSKVSGPIVGGVFAAAPAIWSSSLYVTSRRRGIDFSRSLTLKFMEAGILTVVPFGIADRYFFPLYGALWGTLLAYLAIAPLALLAWWVTNGRRARPANG